MRISRLFGTMLLLAQAVWAQYPPDISFTLATKNGKVTFPIGEAMPVELGFQSSAPGRCQVITDPSQREHLNGARVYDQLTAEPAENVVDPLREQTRMVEVLAGPPPRLMPVTGDPVVVEQLVNEWISFRKPGHYRISAQTKRLSLSDRSPTSVPVFMPTPIPIRSNTIEIEVVAPEPGWADAQLQEAVASLSGSDVPRPAGGQVTDLRRDQRVVEAARVLRFLETRDAALALVRFFDRGLQMAQNQLQAGLYGSPYRDEVIAALQEGLTAPDVPVTSNWMETISELTTAHAFGPCPLPEKNEPAIQAWLEHYRADRNRYMEMLSEAVSRKQGQARAVSLDVLSRQNGANPAAAPIAAVLGSFHELPLSTQQRYLTLEWYRIASPTIEPLVRSLAEGTGPLRDAALMRLQELDPAGARPIIINRIRKGDVTREMYSKPRALLLLPDQTLPEMDEPLVNLLEQGKPVGLLVARYATDAAFDRIRAWVEAHPNSDCNGPNSILPYLFRVNPAYAADRLARARDSQADACQLSLSGNEDLLMSPGMEKAAIADLASPSLSIQRLALTLLQYGGSPASEQPLWDGLARLRESGKDPGEHGLEYGYVSALTNAIGWVLTPEKLNRLAAACITDSCRQNVDSAKRRLVEPLGISLSSPVNRMAVMIGPYEARSMRQLDAKIRQFPRGSRFFFQVAYQGNWFYEQRMIEIRRVLDAAGMVVVAQPARK